MFFCYLDESGGCEALDDTSSTTPVMVIVGVIVSAEVMPALTRDFLALKREHFPEDFARVPPRYHILTEVKGSYIQWLTRSKSRDKRRRAQRFRKGLLDLTERHGCKVVGRIWVKKPGEGLDPVDTYCNSVCKIASYFGQYLRHNTDEGIMIADHRSPGENIPVAHAVFTEKWRPGGDGHPQLREVPMFADSKNHAGLQIADLVASTLVFPMALAAFCHPHSLTIYPAHSSPRYEEVRQEFGLRLMKLEYRYRDHGWPHGGIVVSDPLGFRSREALFAL